MRDEVNAQDECEKWLRAYGQDAAFQGNGSTKAAQCVTDDTAGAQSLHHGGSSVSGEQITALGTVKRVAEQLGSDPTLVLQLHYCAHRAAFVATYVGATEERATAHHHNLHDALRAVVATLPQP